MEKLKIANVGQGDCIIITPDHSCCYSNQIIIDCGPGTHDYTSLIDPDCSELHVALTHTHADHINGFPLLLTNYGDKVQDLILPFHQNEIVLIANSLLKLKGIKNVSHSHNIITELNEIVAGQYLLKAMLSKMKVHLRWAYDGEKLCNHLQCFNPPLILSEKSSAPEPDSEVFHTVISLFEPDYQPFIATYFRKAFYESNYFEDHQSYDKTDDEIERLLFKIGPQDLEEVFENERDWKLHNAIYVFEFFHQHLDLLTAFNHTPSIRKLQPVSRSLRSHSHDVCLVLKYQSETHSNNSVLLTGDASLSVFHRLISDGKEIQCTYLKMPHHGSIKNIDEETLRYIHPSVAILSHNNRRFGYSRDSHPNTKTLELLDALGIKIYTTNDIIKNNSVILKKAANPTDAFLS